MTDSRNLFVTALSRFFPYKHKTVVITNTQIKALPSARILLVPAPGVGRILHFIGACYTLNTIAAYTNVKANASFHAQYDSVSGLSNVASCLNQVGQSLLLELSSGLVNGFLSPFVDSGTINGFTIGNAIGSDVSNKGLYLSALNPSTVWSDPGNQSDFTGGNSANTLTVTTLYADLG